MDKKAMFEKSFACPLVALAEAGGNKKNEAFRLRFVVQENLEELFFLKKIYSSNYHCHT